MSATMVSLEKRMVLKKVGGWDQKVLIRTGVLLNECGGMGLILYIHDRQKPHMIMGALEWSLMYPHDLLSFWRASLILRKLKEIKQSDLACAFSIADRNIENQDLIEVFEISKRLSSDDYREIMATKVPKKIVKLLKYHANDLSIPTETITDEVRAGTLEWDEQFSKNGVLHPDEQEKLNEEAIKAVGRYERYLSRYAYENKIPRDSILFNGIADYLYLAIQRGIETRYGMSVALGFAITVGERSCSNFIEGNMSLYADDEADYLHMDQGFKDEVKKISKWLSKNFRGGLFKRPVFTKTEFEKLILDSVEEYELDLESSD